MVIGGVEVRAILADEPDEWSRGLQGYDELAAGEGMLFDFGSATPQTFTMKGVTFPIDVVFVDADLAVSAIEPLDPGSTRLVPSPSPSPYVIELPQGWAAEKGIDVGDTVEVLER